MPELLLHIDCASGVAGDMLLASLLDLGASTDAVNKALEGVFNDTAVSVIVKPVTKAGISAKQLVIADTTERKLRHWSTIKELLEQSGLSTSVKSKSLSVIRRIAEVEAAIHDIQIEKVHFHEIGAIDTIVDVVGTVVAIEELQVNTVSCSAINVGGGTVRIDHGRVPVPAPATLALATDMPLYGEPAAGELATPTGIALLAELASTFSALPDMQPKAIGYGAGEKDRKDPNVVRATLGTANNEPPKPQLQGLTTDSVIEVDCDIDDQSPETLAEIPAILLGIGALDVSLIPTLMKKGRPALRLSVLTAPANLPQVVDGIFKHTTTFGVRYTKKDRLILGRTFKTVVTKFGDIRVKLGHKGDMIVTASPEFEVCKKVAESKQASIRLVMAAASEEANKLIGRSVSEIRD